jgi:hypothetical protein
VASTSFEGPCLTYTVLSVFHIACAVLRSTVASRTQVLLWLDPRFLRLLVFLRGSRNEESVDIFFFFLGDLLLPPARLTYAES